MDYNSGKLKCKRCGLNKMNIYENWLNRKIYINNSLETQWIFYNRSSISEKKKFSCNHCYKEFYSKFFEFWKRALPAIHYINICGLIDCIIDAIYFLILLVPLLIFSFLYGLIYILVIFWIDICKCLCSGKTTYFVYYLYIENHNMYKGNIITYNKINKCDIWKYYARIIENNQITKPEEIFTCLNCNYHYDSFKDFIPNISKYIRINNNIENNDKINNLNITPGLNINDNISIVFRFCDDQSINHSITGKLTDTFKNFEKKLIEKNPSLKNKKLFYLFKGQAITDKHITLEQLNIKNLDIVLFKEVELI